MKKIKPEDLSLNARDLNKGSNDQSPQQAFDYDDRTKLTCHTGPNCDTQNNCDTKDFICDTLTDCVYWTRKCHVTDKCQTTQCGDTQTKAEICCAETNNYNNCVIYTKECPHTNPCLISKELECETENIVCAHMTDVCVISENVCSVSSECEETQVCPTETIICKNRD